MNVNLRSEHSDFHYYTQWSCKWVTALAFARCGCTFLKTIKEYCWTLGHKWDQQLQTLHVFFLLWNTQKMFSFPRRHQRNVVVPSSAETLIVSIIIAPALSSISLCFCPGDLLDSNGYLFPQLYIDWRFCGGERSEMLSLLCSVGQRFQAPYHEQYDEALAKRSASATYSSDVTMLQQ